MPAPIPVTRRARAGCRDPAFDFMCRSAAGAALRLYDAAGMSLVAHAAPGSSADATGPGDYAVELHAPSARATVALVLSLE